LTLIIGVGCSGDGSSEGEGSSPSPAPISRKLFVTNSSGDKISVFDVNEIFKTEPDVNGIVDVAPIRTIGSKTGLSSPGGVFVDTKNNEIFVTNSSSNTITVYRRTADGDVSPKRTIAGPNTGLSGPVGIFVDTEHDEIFVANSSFSSITVYGRTAKGDVVPKRTLGQEIFSPKDIFVDTKNDEIFIANSANSSIVVYERDAEFADFPKRILFISGPDEGAPFRPSGIYVDIEMTRCS
jgi:Uncharacterized conserved protein